MAKLGEKFCSIKMSWKKVMVLAVISAVLSALTCIVGPLKDTGFHDMAVYPDAWFFWAMLIVMNCKKWSEASLKTFIFFLISQPLIYLLQVPFSSMGFGLFMYYKRWFLITWLTLPGAAIAYLTKKQNWLSVIVLTVANLYLAYAAAQYMIWNIYANAHHWISAVFCFLLASFFCFGLLKKKKHQYTAWTFFLLALAASAIYLK